MNGDEKKGWLYRQYKKDGIKELVILLTSGVLVSFSVLINFVVQIYTSLHFVPYLLYYPYLLFSTSIADFLLAEQWKKVKNFNNFFKRYVYHLLFIFATLITGLQISALLPLLFVKTVLPMFAIMNFYYFVTKYLALRFVYKKPIKK